MFKLAVAVAVVVVAASVPETSRDLKIAAGLREIAFNESYSQWMTPKEIESLPAEGRLIHFIDITDEGHVSRPMRKSAEAAIPQDPRHQPIVNDYITNIQTSYWTSTINTLSNYHTRWYTTQTGRDAVLWLAGEYRRLISAYGRSDVTVEIFEHSAWLQPSLIVRMPGSSSPSEIVVLGGHIDSTAGGATARAPGADDDGSGSQTVLHTFKILLEKNFRPSRTLEFHAYAAEEAGLRGSAEVARAYAQRDANVVAMMQADMTCFRAASGNVGVITDFTNPTLTAFFRKLIASYMTINGQDSRCGYGCSDHASWTAQGYPAAFIFEAPFGQHSPHIHTIRDTIQNCNAAHAMQFVRLALGFVVELSLD